MSLKRDWEDLTDLWNLESRADGEMTVVLNVIQNWGLEVEQ